jgi:hypothetical protein
MSTRPVLLAVAITLALSGCGDGAETGTDHGHEHAAGTDDQAIASPPPAAPARAPVTEAIYGDEAPVELAPAEPADDHGHAHNADGSHVEGGDDHGHPHEGDAEHDEHPHDDGDDAHDH